MHIFIFFHVGILIHESSIYTSIIYLLRILFEFKFGIDRISQHLPTFITYKITIR